MEHIVQFPKLGWEFILNETAFTIGSFSMKWYGLLITVGFLLSVAYGFSQIKKMNINGDKLVDVVIVGLICAVIGLRLYFVIFYPVPEGGTNPYYDDPMKILRIWEGGLGFFGGLIGAVIGGIVMTRIRKMSTAAVLDIVGVSFLIGQAIGRWGNYFNQEAFGSNTDSIFGMISDATTSYLQSHQGALLAQGITVDPLMPVHPTFLYESVLCAVGFILLHFFNTRLRRYDGQTFLMYILWYGACRFFIESVRTDSLMVGPFKVSMVVAAALVLFSAVMLIILRKRTVLTGCGSKKAMELNGIGEDYKLPEADSSKQEETAINTEENSTEKIDDQNSNDPEAENGKDN